jgi:hypothetical protein
MRSLFLSAVFSLGLLGPALAQEAKAPVSVEDTQAVIGKLNVYVGLLNQTLRAQDSRERYASWIKNMKSGPTGRETIVYGLYSLHDASKEIEAAKAATGTPPAMAELDAAIPDYIVAYEALGPIVAEADGYYERQDYMDDKMAGGKELHTRLAPAFAAFQKERDRVDALFAAEKERADLAELAMIEQMEGRKARWHVSNVLLQARKTTELFPTPEKPVVDMPRFEAAVKTYADAVRDMDAYGAANSGAFSSFDSQPRSYLGRLREFRDDLKKVKGDARRGPGEDLHWLVSDYNRMISMSRMSVVTGR